MGCISECFCNSNGSSSFICNATTGQCNCNSNLITGLNCDQSETGYYGFPDPKRM